MKLIPCNIFNSLAKPHLEALDDEEEGELEKDDDDEEEGQKNQEQQVRPFRNSTGNWGEF